MGGQRGCLGVSRKVAGEIQGGDRGGIKGNVYGQSQGLSGQGSPRERLSTVVAEATQFVSTGRRKSPRSASDCLNKVCHRASRGQLDVFPTLSPYCHPIATKDGIKAPVKDTPRVALEALCLAISPPSLGVGTVVRDRNWRINAGCVLSVGGMGIGAH